MKFQKGIFEIFLLGALWGPSFLFAKVAGTDLEPLTISALRVCVGALLLYSVLKFKKINLWKYRKQWFHCFVVGVFVNGVPWACFNYAVHMIPTSLAALINGTTPVFTIILANIFLREERLTWSKGIGVGLGLLGCCVLFLPAVLNALTEANLSRDIYGILLSFIATASYGMGWVYVQKHLPPMPPLVAPVIQVSSSLLYFIPLILIFESPFKSMASATLPSWLSVLGLGVLGTAFAFIMFYRIIERQGATAASTVTYLLPIFGAILGVVFLGETINLQFCFAAVLIFSGVLIVNGVISFPRRMRVLKEN